MLRHMLQGHGGLPDLHMLRHKPSLTAASLCVDSPHMGGSEVIIHLVNESLRNVSFQADVPYELDFTANPIPSEVLPLVNGLCTLLINMLVRIP